jgi:anti-sigma B factor antagonist
MNITTRDEGRVAVISLHGKIMSEQDIGEFMNTVKQSMYESKQKIVVDLAGVDWINSSGLGMLVAAQGLLVEIGGHLRLAAVNDTVNKVITTNKLHLVLQIDPSVKIAVETLN